MERHKKYIEKNTFSFFEMQKEMEDYAQEYNVPIITKDSLDLLMSFVKIKKPKKIFEFGAAIGYSAIAMAVGSSCSHITTIERDLQRYNLALENISKMNLQNRIKIYNVDAKDSCEIIKQEMYDLVFIDAAKGHYREYFDMIFENVNKGGIILSDNIFYKGLIFEENASDVEKKQRTIYKRMTEYIKFLKSNNENFFTSLVPIGDGIAITYKCERE